MTGQHFLDFAVARDVARAYRNVGGNSIKISGGDPVFWPHLEEYACFLKEELKYGHVEIITRSPRILERLDGLSKSEADLVNFSLDALSPQQYAALTGKSDFCAYIAAVKECAIKLPCKINMVVLPQTEMSEIRAMVDFCIEYGIRQLKLLDYIPDINNKSFNQTETQENQFSAIYAELRNVSKSVRTVFQGGLGHPMTEFVISDSFKVICKDAAKGAWYGPICHPCLHYPCHDAVMALRLTPGNSFQFCLMNPEKRWMLNRDNVEGQLKTIIALYARSKFVK